MELKTKKEFLEKLIQYEKENSDIEKAYILHNNFNGQYTSETERLRIDKQAFTLTKFRNTDFNCLHFINCEFEQCEFDNFTTWNTIFENCHFSGTKISTTNFFECDFINCEFNGCRATYLTFSESSLSNVKFNYCIELLELYFGGVVCINVAFTNSEISHSRFQPNLIGTDESSYYFNTCEISDTHYNNNDLSKSKFESCILNKSVFSNCLISDTTFSEDTESSHNEYSSIDFHTLNRSQPLSEQTLRNVFGIVEKDIKAYTIGLCNDVYLQNVFISYSFKDKQFAQKLNEALKAKGVLTFLWEKDAPGGRPLKRIMMDNVKKYDRLLFIASNNSVRSQACQFELTEGRKKQELNWATVFFPIHIDTFLFDIEKIDIRPLQKQDEYWDNITELKEINSVDFCEFNSVDFDAIKFEEKITNLVNNLK